MKGSSYVLLGIALILYAGVVLYNVVTIDLNSNVNGSDISATTTNQTTKNSSTTSDVSVSNSKININKASAEELETLKGIGPSKAKAIVEYREQNGNFNSVDELTNVSGIGDKTLSNIKDDITVD